LSQEELENNQTPILSGASYLGGSKNEVLRKVMEGKATAKDHMMTKDT